MITIPSGIKDPSYRYKMPKLDLKQESRLNGAKTNIFNVDDVAKSLRVPSKSIMKWFCSEFGAAGKGDSTINGHINYKETLEKLDKYIERYVICKKCKYPELQRYIEGKHDLKSKCNSCGTVNTHDGMSQAGKVLLQEAKDGSKATTDITEKDKVKIDDEDSKTQKNDKKKDKKKEEDISDLDDEVSWKSKRVGK